jgi:hypothetical protein
MPGASPPLPAQPAITGLDIAAPAADTPTTGTTVPNPSAPSAQVAAGKLIEGPRTPLPVSVAALTASSPPDTPAQPAEQPDTTSAPAVAQERGPEKPRYGAAPNATESKGSPASMVQGSGPIRPSLKLQADAPAPAIEIAHDTAVGPGQKPTIASATLPVAFPAQQAAPGADLGTTASSPIPPPPARNWLAVAKTGAQVISSEVTAPHGAPAPPVSPIETGTIQPGLAHLPRSSQRVFAQKQSGANSQSMEPSVDAQRVLAATTLAPDSATPLVPPVDLRPESGLTTTRTVPIAGRAPTPSRDAIDEAPQPVTATRTPSPAGVSEPPLKVAFTATLHPVDTTPEEAPAASPQESQKNTPGANRQPGVSQIPEVPASPTSSGADNSPGPTEGNSLPLPVSHEGQGGGRQERGRKPQEEDAPEAIAGSASGLATRPPGTLDLRPTGGTGTAERPAPAEPPAETAKPQAEPAAEPPKTAAAHDIRLQVGGEGDRKVEVRVTERDGDVHVAVRTSDTRLAGELREDLPALASRLEQSGFHAETWRPAATGERQHLAEPQAGTTSQDAQGQSRQDNRDQQRDQQEQRQQDPGKPDNPSNRKQQRKDFEWLLSSLR